MKKILVVVINALKESIIIGGIILSGCSTNPIVNDNIRSNSELDTLNQQIINVQSPSYIFRQGDQLRITIRGYPEFDTTMVVNDVGTISMRYIGDLIVAGITRAQLSEDIVTKLSDYIKTEIFPSIVVLNALTQKVAVLGAVGRQENYSIQSDVTVLQILAMAGGATAESDLQHIKIFRNGDSGYFEEIDITKYISNGNISEMPLVKPGDTVYVPREENIIRELSSFFRDTIFIFTLFTISN
ncbi:MAG: polysaccharide biosynthesis/export family protein [Bacteroidota bacterium]|nr:polysaccharide biosynthesis/export family protein [Bacteroidota bacterium]